ncbi:MAG: hypothetical protein IPI97_14525 [Nitrosomonas sp.]|nr:hypothetical protein [Nitrosomonas sp.]
MGNKNCKNEDCEWFPFYGVAPHTHQLNNGSFIGSTRIKPKEEWPKSFIEDKQEPGLGTYYCPDCFEEAQGGLR